MEIRALAEIPPWEWPADAGELAEAVLRDRTADGGDRQIAAYVAGDATQVDDRRARMLLEILRDGTESETMRGQAVISLGPVLETAHLEGFEFPEEVPISEDTFQTMVDSLRELYLDTTLPKLVRRRILEGSVRAPQDWHREAVQAAYKSPDPDWQLTGVFAMQWVAGFEDEILEALASERKEIRYEAVQAAGEWGMAAAWPAIKRILASPRSDGEMLLAAIEAAGNIAAPDAETILAPFHDSDDEEISEAAFEAIRMAQLASRMSREDEEDEDYDL